MAINGEWDLRANYEKFNEDDIDGLMALFAPRAVYHQLGTSRTAVGLDQIRSLLASWDVYLEGAAIIDVRIKSAPWLVEGQRGAASCYNVDYIGTGRYVRTLPGMKGNAEAHGDEVRIPTGETVWFNTVGRIIRVDQTMNIAALR